MDLEPILGALGARWGIHTLGHLRVTCAHTHLPLFPHSISSPPAGMFLGGGWKLENLDPSGYKEKVHRNSTQTEAQAQDQTRTLELWCGNTTHCNITNNQKWSKALSYMLKNQVQQYKSTCIHVPYIPTLMYIFSLFLSSFPLGSFLDLCWGNLVFLEATSVAYGTLWPQTDWDLIIRWTQILIQE